MFAQTQNPLRYGGHVRFSGTMYGTLADNPTYYCLQTYLGSPTTYQTRTLAADDRQATATYCRLHDVNFYIHCPLVSNLARNPWVRTQEVVTKQLQTIAGLRAACVLHIGRVGKLSAVIEHLNDLQVPSSTSEVPRTLLLENAAGQGTELGSSWDELRNLFEGIDSTRIGLCIDTQHAFAAGMQRWDSRQDVEDFFDNVSDLGIPLGLLHLNDSQKFYGSRVDRHLPLGEGYIWQYEADVVSTGEQADLNRPDNLEGLRTLLERCAEQGIDVVAETGQTEADAAFIRQHTELLA